MTDKHEAHDTVIQRNKWLIVTTVATVLVFLAVWTMLWGFTYVP